jgi:hypothetical protein
MLVFTLHFLKMKWKMPKRMKNFIFFSIHNRKKIPPAWITFSPSYWGCVYMQSAVDCCCYVNSARAFFLQYFWQCTIYVPPPGSCGISHWRRRHLWWDHSDNRRLLEPQVAATCSTCREHASLPAPHSAACLLFRVACIRIPLPG